MSLGFVDTVRRGGTGLYSRPIQRSDPTVMKDLGEGINGPPLLDPCQGHAGLLVVPCLGRASGTRWQPRHNTTTQTLLEAGVFDFPRWAKPSAAA